MAIEIAKTVARIAKITDEELLLAIANACNDRLTELAAAKPIIIRALLRDGVWCLVYPDGTEEEIGVQLTPVSAIARAKQPPPKTTEFEISKEEASGRRHADVQSVGWWDVLNGDGHKVGTGYYDVAAFHSAQDKYRVQRRAIDDPRAAVYRLPDEGITRVLALEDEGALVLFEGHG